MQIRLELIKPSPRKIRTTWDEEKLNELAQSIKEQGLIVPIKVRPQNEHYEIVYGHRRAEAARRAGLDEIEVIVEGVDDTDALLQAGMENLSKDDMTSYDKGKWSVRIRTMTGWSIRDLSIKSGIGRGLLSDWENYYEEVEKGTAVRQSQLGGEGVRQTMEIKKILSNPVDKKSVAEKVEKEGLTWQQTRQVAESIAATKDPARREALLRTPYSSFIHDPEINKQRADKYGAYDPQSISKNHSPGTQWEMTIEVKILLDYLQSSHKMADETIKMDEMGKFASEARQFIAGKITAMIEKWQYVVEELEKPK